MIELKRIESSIINILDDYIEYKQLCKKNNIKYKCIMEGYSCELMVNIPLGYFEGFCELEPQLCEDSSIYTVSLYKQDDSPFKGSFFEYDYNTGNVEYNTLSDIELNDFLFKLKNEKNYINKQLI